MSKLAKINYLDPRWNYPYKGFTSIVNQTVEIAKTYRNHHVDDVSFCIDDEQINYFFESKEESKKTSIDASSWWLEEFLAGRINNSPNSHDVASHADIALKKHIFDSMLALKREFEISFKKDHVDLKTTECLGIQIRGTDKCQEIPRIDKDVLIKKINYFLENSKESYSKILLSTDDLEYADAIWKHFGSKNVVEQKSVQRSIGEKSVHHNQSFDKNEINKQVLWDVYALSNSKSMLYTFSNVSHLALCLGCNNHKEISCLSI